jgi:photosystem II stability/assembly factor-like uncharacterized protein
MNRLGVCGSILSIALVFAGPARAGLGFWSPYGSGGGPIQALVAEPGSPSVVYSISLAGDSRQYREVYRSEDRGLSWQWASLGLGGEPIGSLAADSSHPGTLYAVSQGTFGQFGSGGGVFVSSNGGRNWTFLSRQTEVLPDVSYLTVVPRGATAPPVLLLQAQLWVRRSTDGGHTWAQVLTASPDRFVAGVASDPTAPQTLYVGLTNSGLNPRILRSDDAGATWTAVAPLSPTGETGGVIGIAPTSPPTVVAATQGRGYGFKSTDKGAHWQRIPLPLDTFSGIAFAADPVVPQRLWASGVVAGETGLVHRKLFTSTDAGSTWERDSRVPDELATLAVQPETGDLFGGGSSGRAFVAPAPAHDWRALDDKGLLIRAIPTFSRGADPRVIYRRRLGAAADEVSVDRGRSWRPTLLPGPLGGTVFAEIDPVQPAVRYASIARGVYRTTDGGRHWQRRGKPTFDADSAPATGNTVAAVAVVAGPVLLATPGCGVARSGDGGATWTQTFPCLIAEHQPSFFPDDTVALVDAVIVHPSAPGTIYLRAHYDSEDGAGEPDLYQSVDAGLTWTLIYSGMTDLRFAPGDLRVVYLTRPEGILQSTDAGQSFHPAGALGYDAGLNDLEVDASDPRRLYAATKTRGVLESHDGGVTFEAINTGLPRFNRLEVRELAVHPTVAGQLYAYPERGGTFEGRFVD